MTVTVVFGPGETVCVSSPNIDVFIDDTVVFRRRKDLRQNTVHVPYLLDGADDDRLSYPATKRVNQRSNPKHALSCAA